MGPGGGKGVRGITGPTVSKVNKLKVVFACFLKTFTEQLFNCQGHRGEMGPRGAAGSQVRKHLYLLPFLQTSLTSVNVQNIHTCIALGRARSGWNSRVSWCSWPSGISKAFV